MTNVTLDERRLRLQETAAGTISADLETSRRAGVGAAPYYRERSGLSAP